MENYNDQNRKDAQNEEVKELKQQENNRGNEEDNQPVEPKPVKKKGHIIWIIIGIIVVLIAVVLGYFWLKMNKLNQTEIAPEDIEINEIPEDNALTMGEYTNIALFGIDNRSNGNYGSGNSDTIIIASINNESKEIKLVSVYRDTYLRVNNNEIYGKANSAYAYNGAAGGLSMLNTNFDLNINRYVSVDWHAVASAINLLGGLEIEITEPERQEINRFLDETERVTGIETSRVQESGLVALDGVQAATYARIRKLAGNDYKRTQRQRIVIEAMFNKAKSANLATLNAMIDEIFPMIETNLEIKEIIGLAMNAAEYSITSTTGFPFEKDNTMMPSSGDVVVPITLLSNVIELHQYLFDEEVVEVSDKVLEINQRIIEDTGLDVDNSEIDSDSYTTGIVDTDENTNIDYETD